MTEQRMQLSRRKALAGLAGAVACGIAQRNAVAAESAANSAPGDKCTGPVFSSLGPDAELYGAADGYPVPDPAFARRQGNPWEPKYRVGAFSHIDEIYNTRLISRAATHARDDKIRRWLARAAEPDAAGHAEGRSRLAHRAPRRHADQVL